MTLNEIRTRWLGRDDWTAFENWPRQTRWIAQALCVLTLVILETGLLLWPAWQSLNRSHTSLVAMQADLQRQRALLDDEPKRRKELLAMVQGRDDPLGARRVTSQFGSRSPMVSVFEGEKGFSVDGQGTASDVIAWLEGLRAAANPALVQWVDFKVERDAHSAQLNWTGTLQRMDVTAVPPALVQADGSPVHASTLGRDPFAALQGEGAATNLADVAAEPILPEESRWPRPLVTEWPIAQLRMIGTLGSKDRRALLMAGTQSVYSVSVGDSVGTERQRVLRLLADRVVLRNSVIRLAPQILETSR